jgi:phosphopantothenoylcysteine decarboxylase / phosphopantothenate---cysteine ligase
MATPAPVLLVPAMNTNMYLNSATQANLSKLKERGIQIIEPASGMLACGTEGIGRLPEPADIVEHIKRHFRYVTSLQGVRILVTAGGTREAIDPVRFISNRSSGKMGFAIAAAAAERGADVTLVSGPVSLPTPCGVKRIDVESALQMRDAVLKAFPGTDIVIKSAAVADYRPEDVANQKIKKSSDSMTLVLIKNPDILAELGQLKTTQFLVGFAAETQELIIHATEKLIKKNLDMLVANDVTMNGAGFESDTNIIKILTRDGAIEELPQMSKSNLGQVILDRILAKRPDFCKK